MPGGMERNGAAKSSFRLQEGVYSTILQPSRRTTRAMLYLRIRWITRCEWQLERPRSEGRLRLTKRKLQKTKSQG